MYFRVSTLFFFSQVIPWSGVACLHPVYMRSVQTVFQSNCTTSSSFLSFHPFKDSCVGAFWWSQIILASVLFQDWCLLSFSMPFEIFPVSSYANFGFHLGHLIIIMRHWVSLKFYGKYWYFGLAGIWFSWLQGLSSKQPKQPSVNCGSYVSSALKTFFKCWVWPTYLPPSGQHWDCSTQF